VTKPTELWVDLSTSVRWTGGVIGIVRAELELARALYALNPKTRFVAFNGDAFVELEHERIKWLFTSRSVADAYLQVRDFFRSAAGFKPAPPTEFPRYKAMLASLPAVPPDRASQLRMSLVFGATALQSPPTELLLRGMLKLYEPFRRAKNRAKERTVDAAIQQPLSSQWELGPDETPVPAPFGPNSTVLCAGWMDTGREKHLAGIKKKVPGMKIAQLIYDVIPIHEDLAHLYPESGSKRFAEYFSWIAQNADIVFCGGENTLKDVGEHQRRLSLPSPPSHPVRFGDAKLASELQFDPVRDYYPDDATLLRILRISQPYVLCVGTIEARKNHAVLYEATRLLFDRHGDRCPLLVFAGISDARTRDLMDSIARDPKTRNHILHIVPTDHQLQVVYRNAAFTLLPSLYEGWSLTLPESLSFGKFVLASDVPPLREIGHDRVEYLPPHEPQQWADRIEHYLASPAELAARERHIKETWKINTWSDCAQTMWSVVKGHS
jgi:glycosyltransferase involved in cell wall biosynthesis